MMCSFSILWSADQGGIAIEVCLFAPKDMPDESLAQAVRAEAAKARTSAAYGSLSLMYNINKYVDYILIKKYR